MNPHTTIFIIESSIETSDAIKNRVQEKHPETTYIHVFESLNDALENKLFQPEIIFVNQIIYNEASEKLLNLLCELIKNMHIVVVSGTKETSQFTKALRNGVDYYIPADSKYLDKVEKYMHCYFTDTIPNKTILLKQWYFELDKEEN